MNELVTNNINNAVAALSGLRQGVANVQAATPDAGGPTLLRMGKDGQWAFGAENIEPETGSEWAINPLSLQHGYVCWTNHPDNSGVKNTLVGETMVPMTSSPIRVTDLPDHSPWQWKPAIAVTLQCVSGEDTGQVVRYAPNSVGGLNAMNEIMRGINRQLDAGSTDVVPVIQLMSDHYNNKRWGKTYIPVLDVVRWVAIDAPSAAAPVAAAPVAAAPVADAPVVEARVRRRRQ